VPLTIEVNDEGQSRRIDRARLKKAARLVLKDAGISSGELSIAVVTDERMHELNRQYLEHDYPTDVLSFLLDSDPERKSLEGQIIVSSDYAAREAARYGWTIDDELLLYVIHGCLHLVGHDDTTPEAKRAMREAETVYLAQFGLTHRFDAI
jgi:probable rRNA maturation factor